MVRVAACLCLLVALPAAAAEGEKPSTPKQFLQSWAKAWKSGSANKMLSYYEDSKDVVAVASNGRSYKGLAGVRTMYEAAFADATWEQVRLDGLVIREDGAIAWGVCRFRADLTPTADKTESVFTSQGSFVLRKRQGAWKIALEHYSPISDVPRVQQRQR